MNTSDHDQVSLEAKTKELVSILTVINANDGTDQKEEGAPCASIVSSERLRQQLLHSKNSAVAAAAKRIFADEDSPAASESHNDEVVNEEEGGDVEEVPVSHGTIADLLVVSDVCSTLSPIKLTDTEESVASAYKPRSGKTSMDRSQRRERNRMHARKTRQRKKEHMAKLQSQASELKEEQVRLRQKINEQNTASVLLVLLGCRSDDATTSTGSSVDPKVDALLKRPVSQIPDSSKVSELPAFAYPEKLSNGQFPNDGIDYQLLMKDRSKCNPDELDRIRKERNRMHAKRTRDRKRIFMEEMEEVIKQLEAENVLLRNHLKSLKSEDQTCHPVRASSSASQVTSSAASVDSYHSDVADGEDNKEPHIRKKHRIEEQTNTLVRSTSEMLQIERNNNNPGQRSCVV